MFRLAIFDNLFIVDSLIEKAILPYFTTISPRDPTWYKITYPYFWHPVKGIIRTITIYMMVVISAERYRSVCYPLCKRHVRKANLFFISSDHFVDQLYSSCFIQICTILEKIIKSNQYFSVSMEVHFICHHHVNHTKDSDVLSI